MTRAILVAVALAQFGGTDSDEGGSGRLRGRYAFSTQRDCVFTTAGFAADGALLPVPQGGQLFRNVSADDGVVEFDGRGHLHQRGRTNSINLNAGPGGVPLSDSDFECEGTYAVQDGTVSSDRSCRFQFTGGPNLGHSGTVTGTHIESRIINGGRILVQATRRPTVEAQVQTTPAGSTITYYRLCERSGNSFRIDDGD